jgi:hypothetical protein
MVWKLGKGKGYKEECTVSAFTAALMVTLGG